MNFTSKTPILKGWSGDKKYCVTDEGGQKYLFRVSDISKRDEKRAEFYKMREVAALGVPMCLPLEFGVCEEGVYSIQGWIDGGDAEEIIPTLPEYDRYNYGYEAGKILKTIHSIPAPREIEPWESRFNRKIDRKIANYEKCPLKYERGGLFLDFIARHRSLLADRPQVYQHGDYHIGNMMIGRDRRLYIIDFNRNDFGDPWEEFNRIVWCAQSSPHFASGMVDGYFGGEVPHEFWQLLALYIASNTLSSLPWAIPFGEGEIKTMRDQAREVLEWYNDMTDAIPTWYTSPSDLITSNASR